MLLILLAEKTSLYKFKFTKIILFFTSLIFSIYNLNNLTYFISDNILREYSNILISLILLLSSFFILKKGYHTIIKVIILGSYFILLFLLLGLVLPSFYIDLTNLDLNIFLKDNLFLESLHYAFLIFYAYFLIYPISKTKFQKRDLIVSSSSHLVIYLLILAVLGKKLINLYEYPFITILKKVSLIDFVERVELYFSLNYLFCFYFFFLLVVYQLKYLLSLKIKKDKKLNLTLIILVSFIFLASLILL